MPVTHIWLDTSEASKKAWATRRAGGGKKKTALAITPSGEIKTVKKPVPTPQKPGQAPPKQRAKPSGTQLKPGATRTTGPAPYEHLRKTLATGSKAGETREIFYLLHQAAGRSAGQFSSLVRQIGFHETMKHLWPNIEFADPQEKVAARRQLEAIASKEGHARAAEDLYEIFTGKRGATRAKLTPAATKPKPKEETVEEYLARGGKIQRDALGHTHIWL